MLIPQSKLVAVQIPASIAANQNVPFKQDPDLLDSYIIGISSFEQSSLSNYIDGSAVVVSVSGLTLTLADMNSKEKNQDFPISDLLPANNAGNIRFFFPYKLKWEKSSFVRINSAAGLTAGESVVFQVYYIKADLFDQFIKEYKFYAGTPN